MSEPGQQTPPPVPPQPPVPEVPRYGEYAPSGYVPPQPAPGYEHMAYPQQPFGAASYPAQPGARQRKTWDLILTVILLVLGFFGMLLGLFYAALLPEILDQAYQQNGITGGFTGNTGAAPAVIAVSHVILYLGALGAAIPLLIRKTVAFWAPLAAGVVAAIIFWGAIVAIFLSDPAFIANATR